MRGRAFELWLDEERSQRTLHEIMRGSIRRIVGNADELMKYLPAEDRVNLLAIVEKKWHEND